MTIPMMILAAACVTIGFLGPWIMPFMAPVVGTILGNPPTAEIQEVANYLLYITCGSTAFLIVLAAIAGLRFYLLYRRTVGTSVTWDCGYAAPSARMQYTASSFAQPVMELFDFFLRTKKRITLPDTYFPAHANFESHTPDIGRESFYNPLFSGIKKFFEQMKVVQEGRIHIYVLYIVVTLLVLLFWQMR